ncbi:hypothetical protein Tco_0781319 [Tanacetum coccineum]
MSNPRREHWEAVKWLLRYLKGTSKATLCFSRKEVILEGFSYSDYGGCLDLGKSTTGCNGRDVIFDEDSWSKEPYGYVHQGGDDREYKKVRAVALLKGRRLRAEGSRLRAEGSDVDMMKRSEGRTLPRIRQAVRGSFLAGQKLLEHGISPYVDSIDSFGEKVFLGSLFLLVDFEEG